MINSLSCIANVTEVIKHGRTQTEIAHDRLNRSSSNKYMHAAKVIINSPIYSNEMLRSPVVHRKISTLTFETNFVYTYVVSFKTPNDEQSPKKSII
jgi:hypothetical protein